MMEFHQINSNYRYILLFSLPVFILYSKLFKKSILYWKILEILLLNKSTKQLLRKVCSGEITPADACEHIKGAINQLDIIISMLDSTKVL